MVEEGGVEMVQSARNLDVHENVLREWIPEPSSRPQHVFPGHRQIKPE